MSEIIIKFEGLEKYISKLQGLKEKLQQYMQDAAYVAADKEVLNTRGLRNYPPTIGQDKPPYPLYIRGEGMYSSPGNITKGSENYKLKWNISRNGYGVEVTNSASYHKYLTGKDDQSIMMALYGWRKISKVGEEKRPEIKKIFLVFLEKLLHDVGLK